MSHRLWKSVRVGAFPFKSIIFEATWKVLKVFNRFFKNLLKYGAFSKKQGKFHIPPVLFVHSEVVNTKWTKSVRVGALPFKSIIFEATWKVLKVFNRFFKNLLKYEAFSKKLEKFHISPVLLTHSDVVNTKWTKSVRLGAFPFKSIIFEPSWKVLKVVNRFLKNVLKYWAFSKKRGKFHASPVLFAHSDTKIRSMGSHITDILYLFSSKAPVIYDDKLVRRSNKNVARVHSVVSSCTGRECYWVRSPVTPLRRIRSSTVISFLILQVSADRAYWCVTHNSHRCVSYEHVTHIIVSHAPRHNINSHLSHTKRPEIPIPTNRSTSTIFSILRKTEGRFHVTA